jgi:hypothetical protein
MHFQLLPGGIEWLHECHFIHRNAMDKNRLPIITEISVWMDCIPIKGNTAKWRETGTQLLNRERTRIEA